MIIDVSEDGYTVTWESMVTGTRKSATIVQLVEAFEAEPVKHGHWKWNKQYGTECSECGTAMFEVIGHIFSSATPKYCPYCGARMDEDDA